MAKFVQHQPEVHATLPSEVEQALSDGCRSVATVLLVHARASRYGRMMLVTLQVFAASQISLGVALR